MGKLFIFGRILGSPTAPFVIMLRDPSSPMMKTVGLIRSGPLILGLSTLLTSLFPPNFKTLFRVFLWHGSLDLLILFYGPTIMVLVQLNPFQNFLFTNNMHLGINRCRTGFGHWHAPKRSKFSSGRLCVIGYPPNNSWHLGILMWITNVPGAIPQRWPYVNYEIATGQKRSAVNP